jgi:hypothetical protein
MLWEYPGYVYLGKKIVNVFHHIGDALPISAEFLVYTQKRDDMYSPA